MYNIYIVNWNLYFKVTSLFNFDKKIFFNSQRNQSFSNIYKDMVWLFLENITVYDLFNSLTYILIDV